MDKISVFGSRGFIGNNFHKMYYDEVVPIGRNIRFSLTNQALYLISTTDNYNVMSDPYKDIDTNLTVLIETLEANKDNKDLVFNFVSSWFVYGDVELPAREDACCKPKGFYSITKKCAEDLLISFCETYGLKYRILRLANVVGVGDKNVSAKKNALQFLIQKLADNEPIGLYYGGDFYRSYISVDDVCKGIHFCIHNAPTNEIINISEGYCRFKTLIEYAKDKLDSDSYIEEVFPSEFHKKVQVKNMCMNNDKLKSCGFKFRKPSGIIDAIDEVIDEIRKRKEQEE